MFYQKSSIMDPEVLKSEFNITKKDLWSLQCKFYDVAESQCLPCLMFTPPHHWNLTTDTVSNPDCQLFLKVITQSYICIEILFSIWSLESRGKSMIMLCYSNFMRKINQEYLKMNWTLEKAPYLNSSLVTEGKEKLFAQTIGY